MTQTATHFFGTDTGTHATCGLAHHSFERLETAVAAGLNGWYALLSFLTHA